MIPSLLHPSQLLEGPPRIASASPEASSGPLLYTFAKLFVETHFARNSRSACDIILLHILPGSGAQGRRLCAGTSGEVNAIIYGTYRRSAGAAPGLFYSTQDGAGSEQTWLWSTG